MNADITKCVAVDDRCAVLPFKPESITKGGLYIPEVAQEKSRLATVVLSSIEGLAVGSIVAHVPWGGAEIKINEVLYLVMRKADIMLIVPPDAMTKELGVVT